MDEKINIQNIIQLLVEKNEIDADSADIFVKTVFNLIKEGLETDGIVKIKGLGTFKLTNVESRESIDVNTGERISINSHTKISFVPDLQMRDLINKPFSYFETVLLNEGVVFDDMPATQIESTVEEQSKDEDEANAILDLENVKQETDITNELLQIQNAQQESILQKTMPIAETDAVPIMEKTIGPIEKQEHLEKQIQTDETTEESALSQPAVLLSDVAFVSEQVIPKTDTLADFEDMPSEQQSSIKKYIGLAVAIILSGVIAGVMFYFYRQNHSVLRLDNMAPVALTDTIFSQTQSAEDTDSLAVKPEVTIEEMTSLCIDTTQTIITGVRKGRESVIPDSTSYRIVGTMTNYKIKRGETLTMVSRHFYDTKDLWPYLVMHNRNIIVNPDNVPSGTIIRIPALRNK